MIPSVKLKSAKCQIGFAMLSCSQTSSYSKVHESIAVHKIMYGHKKENIIGNFLGLIKKYRFFVLFIFYYSGMMMRIYLNALFIPCLAAKCKGVS